MRSKSDVAAQPTIVPAAAAFKRSSSSSQRDEEKFAKPLPPTRYPWSVDQGQDGLAPVGSGVPFPWRVAPNDQVSQSQGASVRDDYSVGGSYSRMYADGIAPSPYLERDTDGRYSGRRLPSQSRAASASYSEEDEDFRVVALPVSRTHASPSPSYVHSTTIDPKTASASEKQAQDASSATDEQTQLRGTYEDTILLDNDNVINVAGLLVDQVELWAQATFNDSCAETSPTPT